MFLKRVSYRQPSKGKRLRLLLTVEELSSAGRRYVKSRSVTFDCGGECPPLGEIVGIAAGAVQKEWGVWENG